MLLLFGFRERHISNDFHEGIWQAVLSLTVGKSLPFKLYKSSNGSYPVDILNAQETIIVDKIENNGDSIRINAPVLMVV